MARNMSSKVCSLGYQARAGLWPDWYGSGNQNYIMHKHQTNRKSWGRERKGGKRKRKQRKKKKKMEEEEEEGRRRRRGGNGGRGREEEVYLKG